MNITYDKAALKAAANYLFEHNKLDYTSPKEIKKYIKRTMLETARKNAFYIENKDDNWVRFIGTMGFMLIFSEENAHIEIDIYVSPSFSKYKYVEESL